MFPACCFRGAGQAVRGSASPSCPKQHVQVRRRPQHLHTSRPPHIPRPRRESCDHVAPSIKQSKAANKPANNTAVHPPSQPSIHPSIPSPRSSHPEHPACASASKSRPSAPDGLGQKLTPSATQDQHPAARNAVGFSKIRLRRRIPWQGPRLRRIWSRATDLGCDRTVAATPSTFALPRLISDA
ncbi:outer membrane autotransporter barrel domain [Marssonina coronariae]|uniref:Outer membrane autotransporter barrel domain n=1 Tax=Diplocarpon coronariae TaxID=2795749 RepID=A0A218Z4G9_9HELO|nr:outer membrane autotransporter barrel domain [Marssonina coronariae]